MTFKPLNQKQYDRSAFAILVEVGFVTKTVDARHLADPSYRTKTVEAIASGRAKLTHE